MNKLETTPSKLAELKEDCPECEGRGKVKSQAWMAPEDCDAFRERLPTCPTCNGTTHKTVTFEFEMDQPPVGYILDASQPLCDAKDGYVWFMGNTADKTYRGDLPIQVGEKRWVAEEWQLENDRYGITGIRYSGEVVNFDTDIDLLPIGEGEIWESWWDMYWHDLFKYQQPPSTMPQEFSRMTVECTGVEVKLAASDNTWVKSITEIPQYKFITQAKMRKNNVGTIQKNTTNKGL